MSAHAWLSPSAAVVERVVRARATAALRGLSGVPAQRLGSFAPAWPGLLAALPGLLKAEPQRLLDAVGRIDVLPVLFDLAQGRVDGERLERALVTLWLAIAGHPGLTTPLALPGPFRVRVVDPRAPRLLMLGDVRGLAATARGAVVIGRDGRYAVEAFVRGDLPSSEGTVIVAAGLQPPAAETAQRAIAALAAVHDVLPGRLERVTIGPGDAELGEARIGADADSADLVASAQAAFVRTAAIAEPLAGSGAMHIDAGRRRDAGAQLAHVSGAALALPWRSDRAAAAAAIARELDDWRVLAAPTPTGAALAGAIAAGVPAAPPPRRALLVNVDANDFVHSFLFGRSVERRCVEHALRLDRIAVDPRACGDIAAELGQPLPAPIADGTELLLGSEDDEAVAAGLARLAGRRYEIVVANVRPRLFHDLLAAGFVGADTVLWDRHLHGGLRAEGDRRGVAPQRIGALGARIWSLANQTGEWLQPDLAQAGFAHGRGRAWPIDLDFFRAAPPRQPDLVFAGGDNSRDWPLLIEAVRDLPLDVHLVTREPPPERPPRVRHDRRLTLAQFRDAMAAATVAAVPMLPNAFAGVTVIPMAMALGVAIVATQSSAIAQYVRDEEEALLVPAGDAAAFRAALVRLHDDAALRARLVANARRRVAELCDLEAFTRELFASVDRPV